MNYHLRNTNENNSKRIFVFECSYFDQNDNISYLTKFKKEFISSEIPEINPCGCFETTNYDLVVNT